MHPLRRPEAVRRIERAASAHRGAPWVARGFTDLTGRASHPCAILSGVPFGVFAKLDPGGTAQFTAELRGLDLLRRRAAVATPVPVDGGLAELGAGSLLLLEAIPQTPPAARSAAQWRAVGHTVAALHRVHDDRFGLADFDGFFGPLPQDNRPVPGNRWVDFYAQRRLLPALRAAVDAGHLPAGLAAGVQRVVDRLPAVAGPEPPPSLLHGDAQQNNVLTGPAGAVLLDAAPYFGHPEVDLALLDYFQPVPAAVFDGYRERTPIDAGFAGRRELWRLYGYLGVVAADGASAFGRPFLDRIAAAVARFR